MQGIEPRWTGMCSACMTISPLGSKIAAEQSRRSLMLAEWAERIRAAPISSQVAGECAGRHLDPDRVRPAQGHRRSSIAPSER